VSALTSGSLADGEWYLSVRVRDVAGNWGPAAAGGPYVIDTTAPSKPETPTAEGRDAAVSLSWQPVTQPDLAHYDVLRATAPEGPYASIGTTDAVKFDDPDVLNGEPYWYSVAAVDGTGNRSAVSAATSATPMATTSLGLVRSVAVVNYAAAVRLTATSVVTSDGVAAPDAGATVQFQAKPVNRTAWTTLATLKTGTTGTAALVHRPSVHTDYRAVRVAGSAEKGAISSPVRVAVRYVTTFKPSKSRVPVRGKVRFYGTVKPAAYSKYRYVYLKKYAGGKWVNVKKVKVTSKGAYTIYWTERRKGSKRFRLYIGASGTNWGAYSAIRTVRWY
jgi:hypothetical protein